MNLEKLKDSARKFEQKEDWRKAIEVYLKAVQQIESGAESSPDLSLYNRVGDLYLKVNDTAAAVRSYERAVDLYADQGFFNNAIALCGKILRVNPGRTQTYLKLAQLHARKNVVIEAKRNLIEFLERMNALGQLDQAFQSVKEFADQFSGSQEIRMMLIELLRAASREDEALEQLAKLAGDIETGGGAPRADAGSVEADGGAAAAQAPRPSRPQSRGDLIFLDTGFDAPVPSSQPTSASGATPSSPAADVPLIVAPPPEGLEPTQLEPLVAGEQSELPEPVSGLEQVVEADLGVGGVGAVPGLEVEVPPDAVELEDLPLDDIERPADEASATEPVDGLIDVADDLDLALPATEVDFPSATEPDADLDLDFVDEEETAPTAGLPLIEPESTAEATADDEVTALENLIIDDPENPDLHRELADRLLLAGDLGRAAEELRLALESYERREDWIASSAIADRLVALEPDAILHHQKRVELAFRTGERAPLLDAYLALADALRRAGATDKALAVYGRVHEHDPTNTRASEAIAALTTPARSHATMSVPAPPAARPAPPAPTPPPAASPPPAATPAAASAGDSFVDLGSMIFEESAPRDTRMRIDRREPQDEDEQR